MSAGMNAFIKHTTHYLKVIIVLLSITISPVSFAAPSTVDSALFTTISAFFQPGQKAIVFSVNKGIVTFKGVIESDSFAANLIARTYALRDVSEINLNDLRLPSGAPISLNAKVIGFTQGSWLREGFFGSGVTTPSAIPIHITISNWIVFLDGSVDNRYILERAIINAQHVAQRIPPTPMRVLSRMMIRTVQVKVR